MNKTVFRTLVVIICAVILLPAFVSANELFTPINELLSDPAGFDGKFVTVSGFYSGWKNAPGSPPVSRSDWVLCDSQKNAIYCTGKIPQNPETGTPEAYWQPMTVLARLRLAEGQPYLEVAEVKAIKRNVEEMVSVAQILFSPIEMQGKYVSLTGVLAKGYGVKGERLYLLADPTGAVNLGRLPKLYPKGTILHIRGNVTTDINGLPMIDNVEIVSVKAD